MNTSNKKQRKGDSRYMKGKEKTEEERKLYRKYFLSALNSILPSSTRSHESGCPAGNVFCPPFISCILPINQNTILQMAVGRNLQPMVGKRHIIHHESIIEVEVPRTCCILFLRDRTIHSGGHSDGLNVRMFGLYGKHNVFACTENKNYSSMLKTCDKMFCKDCSRLRLYKSQNNGRFLPPSKDVKKLKVMECLNDFELITHGFCIVKVSEKAPVSLQNQAAKVGNEMTKGLKFHSIGQEEMISVGTRDIIDVGSELSADSVLDKRLKGLLDEYLSSCSRNICTFLEQKYTVPFTEKGRTLLRSKGPVGNQKLHLDGKYDCTCDS